ncbi:MAG: alpha-2-macroglobulin family protein [Gammaproteobacteria bacterium]
MPLQLPDFNGELRLMAVAWDRSRVGRAESPLLVRDPVVIQAYVPRFLVPDDASRFTLNVQNLSGAAGDYHLQLRAEGAIKLEGGGRKRIFRVADAAKQNSERHVYVMRGLQPGIGRVSAGRWPTGL